MAQWCEMMSEDLIKIGRPRQVYLGPAEKPVEDDEKRGKLLQFFFSGVITRLSTGEGSEHRCIDIIYREDILESVKLA